MANDDVLQRAGSVLQGIFDDDQLRRQLQDAAKAGRRVKKGATGRRKADAGTLVQRAGESVRASSAALTAALGHVEEPPPPKRRGRTAIALALAGGLVAAVAARTPTDHGGVTHGV